jgi:hypothetical protein
VLYWPAVLASFWFVLLMRHGDLGPGFDGGAAFVFFGWLVSAGAGVVSCIGSLAEGSWRRVISTLILPLSVLIAAFNYQAVMRLGEYLHLRANGGGPYSDLPQRHIQVDLKQSYDLYNSGRISADH